MLKSIQIRDFKSLADVSVRLSPVTVLVGRNGTGKSNFVNAIRFLRDFLRGTFQPSELHTLLPVGQVKPKLGISVQFSVEGYENDFCYSLEFECPNQNPHAIHVRSELLKYADETLFHRHTVQAGSAGAWKWIREPAFDTKIDLNQLAIRQMPGYELVAIAHTVLTTGIGCYDFPANVLRNDSRQSNRAISNQGLDDQAANYMEVASRLSAELNTRRVVVGVLRCLNPSVNSIAPDSIMNPQHVVIGHEFSGRRISLNLEDESDGFRRVYAHLLALYQHPPKQAMCFEHPEDGVYPGALGLLADEFKLAAEKGRGQVILTSHSPLLLNHFEAGQIRVVDMKDSFTRIGHLAPEQVSAVQDGLLETGELLTVDKARLAELEASEA